MTGEAPIDPCRFFAGGNKNRQREAGIWAELNAESGEFMQSMSLFQQ